VVTVAERVSEVAAEDSTEARSRRVSQLLEALGVLVSPVLGFFVLRMRAMAPAQLTDPSMHTIFVIDPRDVFMRYAQAYGPTDRLREGARAGFLVPARVCYLLFGAVPGFYVFRYILVLIAVVPVYILLRRLYSRLAGLAGIIVVLSSPVLITAWGTDYPDSAVVSYVLAGLACLAMPSSSRWRRAWLGLGCFFLVMATWAHGMGALLTVATLACYLVVRLIRERRRLLGDIVLMVGVAVVVTGALMLASGFLLGQFDFILPTYDSIRYLSQPSQEVLWHSSSARWAPYVSYLLVPPAVVAGFAVAFARRWRSIGTPQLFVGIACAVQLFVCVYMQFVGSLQTLEMHFFSSTLWASVSLAFAMTIAELGRRMQEHRWARLIPCAVLLLVPIGYAADPHVPTFGWAPWGFVVAVLVVLAIAVARLASHIPDTAVSWLVGGGGMLAATGFALLLTIAQIPPHPLFPGTLPDPPPAYSSALGGSGSALVDQYRVISEIPSFVGNATYSGEQLLTWPYWPDILAEVEALGVYHSGWNALPSTQPQLSAADIVKLDSRRPAELLLMAPTSTHFAADVRALAAYRPQVLRGGVLRSGSYAIALEVLMLHRYPPLAAQTTAAGRS
jgi:hypothetical protein